MPGNTIRCTTWNAVGMGFQKVHTAHQNLNQGHQDRTTTHQASSDRMSELMMLLEKMRYKLTIEINFISMWVYGINKEFYDVSTRKEDI